MRNPLLYSTVLANPWRHAITDQAVHQGVLGLLRAQLERTEFTHNYQKGRTNTGSKTTFQYHMDGYKNKLDIDPGSYPLDEILDVTQLMSMWDGVKDHIYSIHHKLEPRGTTPFKSVMIEYVRSDANDHPICRPNANRMDNYLMLELADGVVRSTEDGFGLYKDEVTLAYTVKWSLNRMLSFCQKNNVTWFTIPSHTISTTRYINIALR